MLTILAAVASLAADANLPRRFELSCLGQQVTVSHAGRTSAPYRERFVVDLQHQRFVRTSTRQRGRVMSSGATDVVFVDEKTNRPEVGAYEMYENLARKLFSQRRSATETVTVSADCAVLAPADARRR